MKVIGLTGGVGCGKSTVAGVIKENFNAKLLIADDIGYEMMQPGHDCYDDIVKYFGTDILKKDGNIDRSKLASIVFFNKEELTNLNNIVHPRVQEYIVNAIKEAQQENIDYVFIESAIILEAGYEEICDEFWYVTADEVVRRKRLMESRGYTSEKIDSIMKNQKNEQEFMKHCQVILDNNGDLKKILLQIKNLLV